MALFRPKRTGNGWPPDGDPRQAYADSLNLYNWSKRKGEEFKQESRRFLANHDIEDFERVLPTNHDIQYVYPGYESHNRDQIINMPNKPTSWDFYSEPNAGNDNQKLVASFQKPTGNALKSINKIPTLPITQSEGIQKVQLPKFPQPSDRRRWNENVIGVEQFTKEGKKYIVDVTGKTDNVIDVTDPRISSEEYYKMLYAPQQTQSKKIARR